MTKGLPKFLLCAVLSLMLAAMAQNYARFFREFTSGRGDIRLPAESFPASLLVDTLRVVNAPRVVFLYSELDCQECVASYLRMLKEASRNVPYRAVQVIACGPLAAERFIRFARIYNLDFSLLESSEEALLETLPGLRIPAIVLIDGESRIVSCWEADPLRIHNVATRIAKHLKSRTQ